MKKILNIIVNTLPIVFWMIWLVLAIHDVDLYPDLGSIQLWMLFLLPLLYSVYNMLFSNNKKGFVVQNIIFGLSQIVGYYLMGVFYYHYVSSDSETILVRNVLSGISFLYIAITTLIFYGIKVVVDKWKN